MPSRDKEYLASSLAGTTRRVLFKKARRKLLEEALEGFEAVGGINRKMSRAQDEGLFLEAVVG